MSGETEQQVSGWTVDTLKELMDRRFEDQDKAVQAALVSQEKAVAAALTAAKEAVDKANTAGEKRFDAVNEFRGQLADQTATLIPRVEAEQRFISLAEKLSDITDRINKSEGAKSGSDITIGKIYAAIGVVGALLGIIVLLANGVSK